MTAMNGSGVHEPVAASDAIAAELEEAQFALGEGPTVDAFAFGSPMLVPDLVSAVGRWPGFVAAASEAGAAAMFALPLHSGAIRVGALALYRARPGLLTVEELADGLVFADLGLQLLLDASGGLTGAPGYRLGDGTSPDRAEVYQATGMIAVQLGRGLEEAFVRLRAHTFAAGGSLADVAADVVAGRLRFEPDSVTGALDG